MKTRATPQQRPAGRTPRKRRRRSKKKANHELVDINNSPTPRNRNAPNNNLSKTLKRLKTKKPCNWRTHLLTPRQLPKTEAIPSTPAMSGDFQDDLAEYRELRKSDTELLPTNLRNVPSDEMMWVVDNSGNQGGPSKSPIHGSSTAVITIDDEIEEGEIVEDRLNHIVDLLEESFVAVNRSRNIIDRKRSQKHSVFYEDKTDLKFGNVPKYEPRSVVVENSGSFSAKSSSDDVICLDSTHSEIDDSVIFVSENPSTEVKDIKLAPPSCLNSPAINNLLSLASKQHLNGSGITSDSDSSPTKGNQNQNYNIDNRPNKRSKSNQQRRIALWKIKKAKEYAEKNAIAARMEASLASGPDLIIIDAQPSTSSTIQQFEPTSTSAVKQPEPSTSSLVNLIEKEKRIILIDGSNVAMQFTDSHGTKKSDKDFSAEGLKICIDHFEKLGFEVKAIVPEYRVRRDKSSNHALMNELKDNGKITVTPSKAYDDRLILEGAHRLQAAIVSNDHFRDLSTENEIYRGIINSRVIRYTWLFGKLFIPEDPYGRFGPKLNDILYKKSH